MRDCFYFHLFANGDDAGNFIVSEADYVYQFNLVAVCFCRTGASVVAFSLEDSHPHFLLYGTEEQCVHFKESYQKSTLRHIAATRGSCDNVVLNMEMYKVQNEDYLRNVATYVCVQSTKDGKHVMQYDYRWGSGSLYFRPENHIPIWRMKEDGSLLPVRRFSEMKYREKQALLGSIDTVPDSWLVCNGLILPDNYVDVKRFESIFRTHNCFRVFSSSGSGKTQQVVEKMAQTRGVVLEDLEARGLCRMLCREMFGVNTSKTLNVDQRLSLALRLRRQFRMSTRQISTLARLPESELLKYL